MVGEGVGPEVPCETALLAHIAATGQEDKWREILGPILQVLQEQSEVILEGVAEGHLGEDAITDDCWWEHISLDYVRLEMLASPCESGAIQKRFRDAEDLHKLRIHASCPDWCATNGHGDDGCGCGCQAQNNRRLGRRLFRYPSDHG